MNKVMLIGNLTRDPQLRTVQGQNGQDVSVCSFAIAVNRRLGGGREQADFFNITCWRGLAESAAKFLAKGKKVAVSGPISVRMYTAQDGTARASMEIMAEDLEFLTPKGVEDGQGSNQAPVPPTDEQTGFAAVETDELPF